MTFLTETEFFKQAPQNDMSREQLEAALKARSKKFGIEIVDGASLTFPAGFPNSLKEYGDPVNLKFPVESPGRSANARSRFKQFAAETYKEEKSRKAVHERIIEAELRHGITPEIDEDDPLDKLLSEALRRRVQEMTTTHDNREAPKQKADIQAFCPIAKVDEELRLVTGIVLEPDEIDSQNDTVSVDEIRKAAHRFLRRFNDGTKLGMMHKKFGEIGVQLVESWIAPMDFKLGGELVKAGSWIMTIKVISDKVWKQVKSGELTGFSIGGVATVEQRTVDAGDHRG